MPTFGREVCVNLDRALNEEWRVSNGIGSYAAGTIIDVNTRRGHGLLVVALQPPGGHIVLLSNIDEEAEVDGRTFYLGANEYPGKIHPGGFVHIEEFRLEDNVATTVFHLGQNVLHKRVWMEPGRNTTYVRYTYENGTEECCLVLHPMCNYRDPGSITKGSLDWNFRVEPLEGGCKVTAYGGATPFWLTTDPPAVFTHTGVWYWHFVYRREVESGRPETEDLYLPGVIRAVLNPGESVTLIASAEPPDDGRPMTDDQ